MCTLSRAISLILSLLRCTGQPVGRLTWKILLSFLNLINHTRIQMVRCQSYLIESITRYRPIGLEGATFILHGSHSMSRQGLYVTVRYPSVCLSVPAADRCSSVRGFAAVGREGRDIDHPAATAPQQHEAQ